MFGNKKEINDLILKTSTLEGQISILKQEFEMIKTGYNSLRGLVNRKLSGSKVEEEEETKDIKGTKYY
jgi:hypothetical protein